MGRGGGCSSAIPASVGESRSVCGAVALSGQVAGRIDAVRPVAEIIEQTVREFFATVEGLNKQYDPGATG